MVNDIYLREPYFAMAYGHDAAIIDTYAKLGISEIWAGTYDPENSEFGTGRLHQRATDNVVSLDDLGEAFAKARQLGIKTSYLQNAACTGNMEFTEPGMRELKQIARFLSEYEVDHIIVANPFLAKPFKKYAPRTKVKLSSHYNATSFGKFKFAFDEFGVDMVIVSPFANKNFNLLRKVVEHWDPENLEVMCTVHCMAGCPMRNWHSQFDGHSKGMEDIQHLPRKSACIAETHHNKQIAMQTSFVRREDIHYYQELGINKFKIGERRESTSIQVKTVEYFQKQRDDFVPFFFRSPLLGKMRPEEMDGFYDKFVRGQCNGTEYDCHDCKHCGEYAERVFTHTEDDVAGTGIPKTREYFDQELLKPWLDKMDTI